MANDITLRPDIRPLPTGRRDAVTSLIGSSEEPATVAVDPATGTIASLRGRFAVDPPSPDATARTFLTANAAAFGIPKTLSGFDVLQPERVESISRVRVQQQHEGLPVFASGVVVDVDGSGRVVSTCANVATVSADVPTAAKVEIGAAAATAKAALAVDEGVELEGKLVILDPRSLLGSERESVLAWKFDVEGPEGKQQVFVDATGGEVALEAFTPATVSMSPVGCPFNPVPQYHLDERTGVPDFITFGPTGLLLPEASSHAPDRVALAFFERYPLVFGTGDVHNQLRLAAVQPDADSPHFTHVVFQQVWAGYSVFGAQLRVHLTPALAVSSINGNYLRDPQVVPVPSVDEAEARDTAVQALGRIRLAKLDGRRRPLRDAELADPGTLRLVRRGDGNGNGGGLLDADETEHEILNRLRSEVVSKGLVILPGVLSRVANVGNHFTYQFDSLEARIFVSAETGEVVLAIPNIQTANRLVYDAKTGSELSAPSLVEDNGAPVGGAALNPDAAAADPLLLRTLGFYAGFGRSSWDGRDADVRLVSNAKLRFAGCPNAFFDPFRGEMWFCLGEVAGDVVAHEFTHGVTWTTAGLLPMDEQGALNEHYSDVMGALAFPDAAPGSWVIGEATASSRDMANPTATGGVANYALFMERTATCAGPLGPLTDPACDSGFVHSNCGIGNRAAVLLSDGDGTAAHTGIGRDRLGRLFFETLTTRMHPWATYLDEVHNTWETARIFAANGTTVLDSTTPAPDDRLDFAGVANEVLWAFTQVGVDQRLITGWFSVAGGLTGGKGTITFNAGQMLPAGFVVSDVELVVRARVGGTPWWTGRSRVSAGGMVTFPGGVFGASVTGHGIGTANEQVDVSFFHSGFIPLDISVNLTVSQTGSTGPATLPTQIAFVSAPRVHWSTIVGGKGDDTINGGISIQGDADAKIDQVEVELLDGNYNPIKTTKLGDPDAVVTFGLFGSLSWGARVVSDGSGSRDETVKVHWWFDIGSACRYRVKYYASGTDVAPG